eukprot:3597259-Karenia_brevis.AAC.1
MASTEESTIDDLIDSVPLLLVPAVQQLIMQPSVIESVCSSDHLIHRMVAAQNDTWFQVPGSAALSHSHRGTQPG